MSRASEMNRVLEELRGRSREIEACAVVSRDGLVIARSVADGAHGDHLGAMSGALLSVGEHAVRSLEQGELKRLIIEGKNGSVIIGSAGPHAALVSICRGGAQPGLLFFDLGRTAEKVRKLLPS